VVSCKQAAAIFVSPDLNAAVLGGVEVGEVVTVVGRAASGSWLYVRDDTGTEGFVWQPYFEWVGDFEALPTREPSESPVGVTPQRNVFAIEYLGCKSHAMTLGSVKGQIFDRQGNIMPGAQVEIWIDGARWNNAANPATANQDGWYEWILGLNQTVRFVALYVDGRQVTLSPQFLDVPTRSGCFQHVNFRQQ
jgi:hypothetical protein